MTDNDEGKFIADAIQELRLRNHYANKDFAILYRTNAQSRSFEESLRRHGHYLHVSMAASRSTSARRSRTMLGYLRVIVNPQDDEALKRIINYPARGIGKTSVDRAILPTPTSATSPCGRCWRRALFGFKAGTLQAIEEFVLMIKLFRSMLEKANAYDIAFHVGKQTGIRKRAVQRQEHRGRAALRERAGTCSTPSRNSYGNAHERGERRGGRQRPFSAYLQQIVLLTDTDKKDPDADTVKMMTIHAAKGLEYPVVFVGGLEEGLFPNADVVSTPARSSKKSAVLFYVAITRAKARLIPDVCKHALPLRAIGAERREPLHRGDSRGSTSTIAMPVGA
jgi:DNA helicase-2/ATP-dependent DNA helicase PcrA